jgi:mRNA deadenylase 3'-5' endonuclease subunit Ccr4
MFSSSKNLNKVKVFNYNVLTPKYCYPKKFPMNKKEDLDNHVRLNKIKKIFLEQMKNESIICLQEVTRDWSGVFQLLCDNNDYNFVKSLYGHPKNGYMGIVIAYPKKYKLVDLSIRRISEFINYEVKKKSYCRELIDSVSEFLTIKDIEDPIFDIAKNRYNTAIALKLQSKENENSRPFWIVNYHMPCVWRHPEVMILHVTYLKKFIEKISTWGCDDCIVAGDFNSKPDSIQYEILNNSTTVGLDNYFKNYTDLKLPKVDMKLESVYKIFHGKEPEATNYSYCNFNGTFKGTLDYIFVNNMKVLKVDEIGCIENYMPNQDDPSDHKPIYCELEINDDL